MLLLRRILFLFLFISFLTCFSQYDNNCEIIDYTTTISIEGGKLITEESYLIRINDKVSNWIGDIRVPYNELDEVTILEAKIFDKNFKEVRSLKKKEIETRSNISSIAFFEDNMEKAFSLNWGSYPYFIKYKYRVSTKKFINIAYWYPYLYNNVYVKKATLNVHLPKDYPFQKKAYGDLTLVENTDQNVTFSWKIEDFAPVSHQVFAPPLSELNPRVIITPLNFNYDLKGNMDSWQSLGEWQSNVNENLDTLPPQEKEKVDQLINGVDDIEEKIKILYNYLQDNHRYIFVSLEKGGLKPYSANYVYENRYGDCKALTMYMKALLKYAGIPSYYTKVYAGSQPKYVDTSLPSPQFNHIILCIPHENDTIWLENTSDITPYNYLGTFTQNRKTLLTNGASSKLVKTPALTLENVEEKTSYHFKIDNDGSGTCAISKTAKGSSFEYLNSIYKSLNKEAQSDKLTNLISIEDFELNSWEFHQEDRNIPAISLEAELTVKNQLSKLGSSWYIQPLTDQVPDLEKPADRKHPVRIHFPINEVEMHEWDIPMTKEKNVVLPEPIKIDTEVGLFETQFQKEGEKISMNVTFKLYTGDYSLAEYPSFFYFFQEIKKYQKKSYIIFK